MLNKKAFTLIEALVAVTILSTVLLAGVSYTVNLHKSLEANQMKIYATHLVADLKEFVDSERQADWIAFQSKSNSSGLTYCFNDKIDKNTIFPPDGACSGSTAKPSDTAPAIFKRELKLKCETPQPSCGPDSSIRAEITVSYSLNGKLFSEVNEVMYTQWE